MEARNPVSWENYLRNIAEILVETDGRILKANLSEILPVNYPLLNLTKLKLEFLKSDFMFK